MSKSYEIIEVTKDNEHKYLPEIVQLEKMVLNKMEGDGKIGQLFITGEDGIKEYINSNSNHVMIATTTDASKQTISASYITQGQIAFTYNDITKYFKCDESYQDYVREKYSKNEFEKNIRQVYIEKICAYKYARDIILKEQKITDVSKINEDEKNKIFLNLIEQEYNDPQNKFHEKSEIRDNLNKYMSLYMKYVEKDLDRYQQFYWIDFNYLNQYVEKNSENKKCKIKNKKMQVRKNTDFTKFDSTIKAYDEILKYQKYKIYDKSHCQNIKKYFEANTENTVEIDTYITHPDRREKGIARILVLEGLKRSLNRLLKNKRNKEIFLVSTLHQENLSSKYVSEFFELKDYLFVNRRNGRDRQVHIYGMKREEVPEYLNKMEKKIAVLYDYNPNNIVITDKEKSEILQEQINYELAEIQRLQGIKNLEEKTKYTGYIKGKQTKIDALQKMKEKLKDCKSKSLSLDGNADNYEPEL